jgi:hypothetical protein
MDVADSSGWLEYFADGPNADFFAPALNPMLINLAPLESICYSKRLLNSNLPPFSSMFLLV